MELTVRVGATTYTFQEVAPGSFVFMDATGRMINVTCNVEASKAGVRRTLIKVASTTRKGMTGGPLTVSPISLHSVLGNDKDILSEANSLGRESAIADIKVLIGIQTALLGGAYTMAEGVHGEITDVPMLKGSAGLIPLSGGFAAGVQAP